MASIFVYIINAYIMDDLGARISIKKIQNFDIEKLYICFSFGPPVSFSPFLTFILWLFCFDFSFFLKLYLGAKKCRARVHVIIFFFFYKSIRDVFNFHVLLFFLFNPFFFLINIYDFTRRQEVG